MTTGDEAPAARSATRTAALATAAIAITLAATVGALEVGLRAFGRLAPVVAPVIRVEPGGRYQEPDPELGFRPLPGRLDVAFGNGDRWTITNRDDRTRITRPYDAALEASDGGIWLFGCSFVQGWGLNDDQTAAWKLQQRLPRHEVVNFGVGGYGTLQSLLQYRRALAGRGTPAAVLLAYADFHDERNTRSHAWRDANVPYGQFGTTAQPYARLGRDGTLAYGFDDGTFPLLWLRRQSRVVNGLARGWGRLQDASLDSNEVSRRLLEEFVAESRRRGVPFLLLGVGHNQPTRDMLRHFAGRQVPTADISVDPSVPANRIRFDSHPSAAANTYFADEMLALLRASGAVTAP